MSETTKVICTFPRREKASTESVEECRKRLLEKFTANPVIESIEKHLGSDPVSYHSCLSGLCLNRTSK